MKSFLILLGFLGATLFLFKLRHVLLGMFFRPDQDIDEEFQISEFRSEEFFIDGAAGSRLHSYLLKPKDEPKAVILYCHGNAGNLTDHTPLVFFLVRAGYAVLTFDYRGYGRSTAFDPSPQSIIDDSVCAALTLKERADTQGLPLVIFGQSLGGAAATGACLRFKDVQGLILEATFSTYREMGQSTNLGHWLYPFTFLLPKTGPLPDLKEMAPLPSLFLHGTADTVVPFKFLSRLVDGVKQPNSYVAMKGLDHLEGEQSDLYKQAIFDFLHRYCSPCLQRTQ